MDYLKTVTVSYYPKKHLIKILFKKKSLVQQMVTIIYWTGLGQITMFRLRIGYNRLNSTQNIQVGSAVIFTCTCGQAPQTAEHIVQPVLKISEMSIL